jgi:hypothetical protein
LRRPPRPDMGSTNSSRVPLATARDLLGLSLGKSVRAGVISRLEFFVPGKREQQSVAKPVNATEG